MVAHTVRLRDPFACRCISTLTQTLLPRSQDVRRRVYPEPYLILTSGPSANHFYLVRLSS